MRCTKFRAGVLAALLVAAALFGYPLARAASPIQLGGSIWPLTLISIPDLNPTDAFNQMEELIAAQAMPLSNLSVNFQNYYNGNPLLEDVFVNMNVASINASATAGYQFLVNNSANVTLYPGNPVVETIGTPTGSGPLEILCSPSGRLVATYDLSVLGTLQPVIAVSGGGAVAGNTGPALGFGCTAGDSISASVLAGPMNTTTNVFVNMPYTWQSSR